MVKVNKIEAKKIYNITEMRMLNIFPWISRKNQISYRNAVIEDFTGENLLKAKITGRGRGRDYKIKGINIINYLKNKSQNGNNKRS